MGEFFYDGSTITPFEVMFVTMNSMIVENNWSFARQALLYQNWMSAQVGGAMAEGAQTANGVRVRWRAGHCCCWGHLSTPRVLSCLPSGVLHASAALEHPALCTHICTAFVSAICAGVSMACSPATAACVLCTNSCTALSSE